MREITLGFTHRFLEAPETMNSTPKPRALTMALVACISLPALTLAQLGMPDASSISAGGAPNARQAKEWSRTLDCGPVRDVSVALFDIDADGNQEIFIGTSKGLDAQMAEIRPACFVALRHDGQILWSRQFPAMNTPDPDTGLTYQTTSVSTPPAFADINGDGRAEIVVGVGGDTTGEAGPGVVGQPGDKGGVYALDADGQILWYHQSLDKIGGGSNQGDGRPDGVYGAPVVYDINGDGYPEVIVNGWDQSTTILRGIDGQSLRDIHLADTIWSTPFVADLDNDGIPEMLVSADITANPAAGTQTGGIFHVISADGSQNTPGFDQLVGNSGYPMLAGKYEEQALWSSPVAADLTGDGRMEVIYGTGNYLQDGRGEYIRVWRHDGQPLYKLTTNGRTFATPLVADLDGDGDLEIVAATLEGYLHGWDHLGQPLFATRVRHFLNTAEGPIFSAPVAADLTGDGKLEILVSKGAQLAVVGHDGVQISDPTQHEYIFPFFKGAVAVDDIDGDGALDIISGGTDSAVTQAVVHRWANPYGGQKGRLGKYQEYNALMTLDLQVAGSGTVEDKRRNIRCTGDCRLDLANTSTVLLTATPTGSEPFLGWQGACTGTDTRCQVALTGATTVRAVFGSADPELEKARAFVSEYMQNLWMQPGDPQQAEQLAQALWNGQLTENQVIEQIFADDRIRQGIDPAIRLYLTYFRRTPDYDGLVYWITSHQNGLPLSDISNLFRESAEFIATYGDLEAQDFVRLVYNNVLGREPDQEGFEYWVNQLQQGMTWGDMMIGFSESAEYRSDSRKRVDAINLYRGLLQRVPTDQELAEAIAILGTQHDLPALISQLRQGS
ncbi:MAG: FG-GAP-like repeat-containing protein [Halothiobacillaceae bacterium]